MSVLIKDYKNEGHYPLYFSSDDVAGFPPHDLCPTCGDQEPPDVLVALGQPDWKRNIDLVQCFNCHTIYYLNPPPPEFLKNYYEKVWNTLSGEALSQTVKPGQKISRRIAKVLIDWGFQNRSCRILDIGCGLGNLLAGLQQEGFTDLWGTEFSPYRVAATNARFPNRIFSGGYQEVPDNLRFDIIYSNHVIEHIYNPLSLFNWMQSRLNPNGLIILSVPDAWYEPVVNQVLFLPHLHSFCAKSLAHLCGENFQPCFWLGDRFWDLTAVFIHKDSPVKKNNKFATLSELTRLTSGSQRKRIRAPWLGNPHDSRFISMRMTFKANSLEEVKNGYYQFHPREILWTKAKRIVGNTFKNIGLKKLGGKILKKYSFLEISPQKADDIPPLIGAENGKCLFDIK